MNVARGRVAVLGAGPWGRNLVRVLDDLDALGAVVDPDPEARRRAAELTGAPCVASLEELAGKVRDGLGAACIATPAATHATLALAAMARGWDVFVEKPLALRTADARRMCERAEARGLVLMTGHLLLHHPAVTALEALVRRGELGDLRYLYSSRLNLGRVRREENILWSFAPHDVALILHLVGRKPREVSAQGGTWLQQGVADVTLTHLAFDGNVKAHVFVSWLHPFKEQKLVVVGSRRMAVFDDLAPTDKLVLHDVDLQAGRDGLPEPRQGTRRSVPFIAEEPLRAELRHFLSCRENRRRPLTDGRHGLAVLEVLERAQATLAPAAPERRAEGSA